MRFREWERTQFWRPDAGGGDIVEGRRQRQLPPSCQPRSSHGSTRLSSRDVQPGSWPLPDSRPVPGTPEKGGGRGQAGDGLGAGGGQPGAPGASGVFRVPERLSLRRALQALAANWFAKEVCGFSSSSFPRSGQRQISRERGPWRRGLLRRVGFPSGLWSRCAASR